MLRWLVSISGAAMAALVDSAQSAHRYPSTDHAELRHAIGEVHGLDPTRIICGVGSDEVINWLCQAYAGPGDEVLFTEHGFAMYRISAKAAAALEEAEAESEEDATATLPFPSPDSDEPEV